jgi:hypothetical protein
MSLELVLLAISVVFIALSLLVSYVNYSASVIGDRYTREHILRERFDNLESEKELWDGERTIKITEPRIYTGNRWDWVKSLLWKRKYPGYTTFILGFKYEDFPKQIVKGKSEIPHADIFGDDSIVPEEKANLSYNAPPSPSEFEENEVLKDSNLKKVEEFRSPIGYDELKEDGDSGKLISVDPSTGYRFYFDTTNPDDIEPVIINLYIVIKEIEFDEDYVELTEMPESLSELR